MGFLGTLLRAVTRGAALYPIMQEGVMHGLLARLMYRHMSFRTLHLSTRMRKEDTKSQLTQELDLDGWKSLMKSDSPEAESKTVSDSKEETSLNAMRELVEMWRLAGKMVPENISEDQLRVLVELPTKSSRKKFLKHLTIKEGYKKSQKAKKKLKEIRKVEALHAKESKEESDVRNTYFMQFWQKSMDNMNNARAAQSMVFGQPLVFDMSYSNYMSQRELDNTVSQLMESEGCNRRSSDPFHIHFCNLENYGPYHKAFLKRYQDAWDKLFLTATEKSYIDVFPANELIYLTADSPNVMKTFEHDKVYIVGSLVDKCQQTGLSLANAKRLKLATLRLPLEKYLQWEVGAKNLTLDQMTRILLTLKDTGDWKHALEFVPKRKHDGFVDPCQLDILRRKKVYEFAANSKKVSKIPTSLAPKSTGRKWWEEDN
ncbi:tRNA methyltransferase 10 homolog C isoform X1 [Ambystoma mexicanum]